MATPVNNRPKYGPVCWSRGSWRRRRRRQPTASDRVPGHRAELYKPERIANGPRVVSDRSGLWVYRAKLRVHIRDCSEAVYIRVPFVRSNIWTTTQSVRVASRPQVVGGTPTSSHAGPRTLSIPVNLFCSRYHPDVTFSTSAMKLKATLLQHEWPIKLQQVVGPITLHELGRHLSSTICLTPRISL